MNRSIRRIGFARSFASTSRGIATAITVLVIIIIILAAGIGYLALSPNKATDTSTVVSTSTSTSTATSVVSSTVTLTKTTMSIFANPLLLYSADAYVNESALLEQRFTAQTGIPMATPVSAGSSALAVDIAAGDPVSVFLSVSRTAVEGPALGAQFPGWAVAFAGDQMGLAYTSASSQTPGAKAVLAAYNSAVATNTTVSWYNFFNYLTSGSVKVGISNPNSDPAGYRAWLVLELAGIAFDGGVAKEQYFVNRMLASQSNVTGASAAALVPALETGQIQFLFIYKSFISSIGLSLVQLGNGVNLGFAAYNAFYGQATYNTVSNGATIVNKASAIVLWLSVPKDSTDTADSISFVIYTIENYQTVLKNFGLVPLSPVQLYNTTATIPAPILALLNTGTLVEKGAV